MKTRLKKEKEQPVQQEQFLVITITPTRGLLALLALVLVTVACLGTLGWDQRKVAASAPAAPAAFTGTRKYYLTPGGTDGNEALTACAAGYHMAALWEILDPSDLQYNTDLGFTRTDSGTGPPTYVYGWVRTGWDSEGSIGAPGIDNCEAWTSDSSAYEGSTAYLANDWAAGEEDIHVWNVSNHPCDTPPRRVWCVED